MTKSRSYTVLTKNGDWLGQFVLTEDGMLSGVTDWGNFSNSWRFVNGDFRRFIVSLNIDYFADKLCGGMYFIAHGRNVDKGYKRLAEKCLPPLQRVLLEDLKQNPEW